jgi:hypothetical protein
MSIQSVLTLASSFIDQPISCGIFFFIFVILIACLLIVGHPFTLLTLTCITDDIGPDQSIFCLILLVGLVLQCFPMHLVTVK